MNSPEKPKAVIWFHAARPCLKQALELLYKNFNNKYKYPVLITTFGKQYSKSFINKIHKNINPEIKFIELPEPKIPEHIKEEELFYNRTDIEYVKRFFPKSRIGYIHTNYFVGGGIMKHPIMNEYDYVLKMDDDTFIINKIDFDVFSVMQDNGYVFASSAIKKYDGERQKNCQIGFRELLKEHIKKNKIKPKNTSIINEQGDWESICTYDPSVWNLNIFRNENWEKWWKAVDESGGIYKYRWGDLEFHSAYVAMFYPDSAWRNFDFYEKNVVIHGKEGFVYYNEPIFKKYFRVFARKFLKLIRLRK